VELEVYSNNNKALWVSNTFCVWTMGKFCLQKHANCYASFFRYCITLLSVPLFIRCQI